MEKYYAVNWGKVVELPKISTDFYAKLQDLFLLYANPDILVDIKKEKGDEEYYKIVSPIFEFMAAVEKKLVEDGHANLEDYEKFKPHEET